MKQHSQRIILTGFMGSGKSTVGLLVAKALGWPFLDTDHLIEARAGRTIPEIFAADGEAGFRALESELLREVSVREEVVIATGGGAIVAEENRRLMKASGLLIALSADPEQILERVAADGSERPLLQVDDPKAEILRLIRVRQPFYEEADYVIDTTKRDSRDVAQEIVEHYKAGSRG